MPNRVPLHAKVPNAKKTASETAQEAKRTDSLRFRRCPKLGCVPWARSGCDSSSSFSDRLAGSKPSARVMIGDPILTFIYASLWWFERGRTAACRIWTCAAMEGKHFICDGSQWNPGLFDGKDARRMNDSDVYRRRFIGYVVPDNEGMIVTP